MKLLSQIAVLLTAGKLVCAAPDAKDPKTRIIVLHAGSMAMPLRESVKVFSKIHPEIEVQMEAVGSREAFVRLQDLQKRCDVFVSSDHAIINDLVCAGYASWNIIFARNEIVLAYTTKSRGSEAITANNWFRILLDPSISYGRSNPDTDPCGYRTLISFKLAQKYYGADGIVDQLLQKKNVLVRPKEIDLIPILQAGQVDYLFVYRSVARQYGLSYLKLPDAINLGNPALRRLYGCVSVEVSSAGPGHKKTIAGEPCFYSLTIPRNVFDRESAIKFLSFLLSPNGGLTVMKRNGLPCIFPCLCNEHDVLPEEIKRLTAKGSAADIGEAFGPVLNEGTVYADSISQNVKLPVTCSTEGK